MNIKQHGSGSIGIIRYVNAALGQIPDQPAVHGSKKQFSTFCLLSGSLYVIQDPFNLTSGEVRVRNQTGTVCDKSFQPVFFQTLNTISGPSALPYNGIVNRLPCLLIPHNCGFSLICNSDCSNIAVMRPNFPHCFHGH